MATIESVKKDIESLGTAGQEEKYYVILKKCLY